MTGSVEGSETRPFEVTNACSASTACWAAGTSAPRFGWSCSTASQIASACCCGSMRAAAAMNACSARRSSRSPIASSCGRRQVDQLLGAVAGLERLAADREGAGRLRQPLALEAIGEGVDGVGGRGGGADQRVFSAASCRPAKASGTSARSIPEAPRNMRTPRSAITFGGSARLASAAASSAGTPATLAMMRRARTSAGDDSIVIRLCTPDDTAEA